MTYEPKINWFALGFCLLFGIAMFTSGWFARSSRAERELSRITNEYELKQEQLNFELREARELFERARNGIESIDRGFETIVESSKRITDRSERVAFLVQRIAQLIRENYDKLDR